jgi:hypothetical protein
VLSCFLLELYLFLSFGHVCAVAPADGLSVVFRTWLLNSLYRCCCFIYKAGRKPVSREEDTEKKIEENKIMARRFTTALVAVLVLASLVASASKFLQLSLFYHDSFFLIGAVVNYKFCCSVGEARVLP